MCRMARIVVRFDGLDGHYIRKAHDPELHAIARLIAVEAEDTLVGQQQQHVLCEYLILDVSCKALVGRQNNTSRSDGRKIPNADMSEYELSAVSTTECH